jgi:hypothetical protein
MMWVRRVLSAPLLLVAFLCAAGTVKIFTGHQPGATGAEGFVAALLACATGAGAYFLLRPDVRRWHGLSSGQIGKRVFANPLGLAVLLWAVAAAIMAAAPGHALLPGFVAQCVYTVLATRAAGIARRFWPTALLALLGFVLLMGALAATAEALTPRGFGEEGMVFLLPVYGFPILLAVFGLARRWRRSGRSASSPLPPPGASGSG